MPIKLRLQGITDLVGPIDRNAIIACYGASQSGKTTLWLEMLYDLSDQLEKPALAYDCEGGLAEFVEYWEPIFREAYPKAQVDVRMKRDYKAILRDHGTTVVPRYSGTKAKSDDAKKNTSGKTTISVVEEVPVSPISKLIEKKGYCAVLYDSITMPMKVFGSDQQNFPARAHAQTIWFAEMLNVIDEHGVIVIANHHASKNPAQPQAAEEMAGGSTVQYYAKIILYLKKPFKAKGVTAYRVLKLARFFNRPPNEHENLIKLTDKGYVDATTEDLERDREAAKK